jgi:integrase
MVPPFTSLTSAVFCTIFCTMASVYKRPRTKYWVASFRDANGRWVTRSTKRLNRQEALNLALSWDNAAKDARQRLLTASQARKVLNEMLRISTGESLSNYTWKTWSEHWLENKTGSSTEATMVRYRQVLKDFGEQLGERVTAPLASITTNDVVKFRDKLRQEGRAVSTCNMVVKKILSVPFESARKLGHIPLNPVAGVEHLREESSRGRKSKRSIREPFTPAELKAIIGKAKGDWKGATILGVTTGLRLGDVVNLRWENVNLESQLISVTTQKTGEDVLLPIHADFAAFLKDHTKGIGKAFVFPTLAGKGTGGKNGLSGRFRSIMEAAKVKEKSIEASGEAGRTRNSKGFHSLRHTFNSLLLNSGVSDEIRKKLTAHQDDRIHEIYSHFDIKTFREAVEKIPSLA